MMKILILCTGNSCRSQMAQGYLQSLDPRLQVFSAGTRPASRVNPWAVTVMREAGIDIAHHIPQPVDLFLSDAWDYVITVCDQANQSCPFFPGKVAHRLHLGFEDPAAVVGSDSEIRQAFIQARDQIMERFSRLYRETLRVDLADESPSSHNAIG